MTGFQRARSPEQREQRHTAILEVAAAMLTELPVAELSLNELARRVGLAKSNVLRYFESREAVLLELLDAELVQWTAALEPSVAGIEGDLRQRVEQLSDRVAGSLAERPVLCDLVAAQAAVLERNISTAVAARHKRAAIGHARALAALAGRAVPELGEQPAWQFAAAGLLTAGALWTSCRPSAAMLAVYEAEPELSVFRLDFADSLRELLAVLASGLLARARDLPAARSPGPPPGTARSGSA